MKLFLLAFLFVAQAVAGPDEDTADQILSTFIKDNGGKNVPSSTFSFPYQLVLGTFTTSIDVRFTGGQMNLDSFSRLSDVDNSDGLAFTAQIVAKLTYAYDFRASVPAAYANGNAKIEWKVPVSLKLSIDENKKASLESIRLLPNGTLVADAVPYVPGRWATLYPRGDSTFVNVLFGSLQTYLRGTFKNIAY